MTHGDLIKALGGPRAVAALLGLKEKTPCKWPVRGIPAPYWLPVVRVANAKGIEITAEDLERTASQYPPTRRTKDRPASEPSPTRSAAAA